MGLVLCCTVKLASLLIRKLSHRWVKKKCNGVVIWLTNVCNKEIKMS